MKIAQFKCSFEKIDLFNKDEFKKYENDVRKTWKILLKDITA